MLENHQYLIYIPLYRLETQTQSYRDTTHGLTVFVHVCLFVFPNDPHTLNTSSYFMYFLCSSSVSAVTLKAPEVQTGQSLFSCSSGYSVLEFIGEGCYGKVAKCRNLATKQTVAVKILKEDTDMTQDTEKEVDLWSVFDCISMLMFVCLIRKHTLNCWYVSII